MDREEFWGVLGTLTDGLESPQFPHLSLLDSEWRKLSLIDLPFDKSGMDPEEFWGVLGTLTDGLESPHLSYFMQSLLALPCSNADVKKLFSSINATKTKY